MHLTITADPVLMRTGALSLGWLEVCAALGLVLALGLTIARARAARWPRAVVWQAAIAGAVTGVGAQRLLSVLAPGQAGHGELVTWLAVACGLAAAVIVVKQVQPMYDGLYGPGLAPNLKQRQDTGWPSLAGRVVELAFPGLLLGQTVALTGSLVAGSAWGQPTNAAWGVVYWHPYALLPPPLLGKLLQPYPLYVALANLLLIALWAAPGRPAAPRRIMPFLAIYIGSHIALGFTRGDGADPWTAWGTGELVSGMLLIAISLAWRRRTWLRFPWAMGLGLSLALVGVPPPVLANGGTMQVVNQVAGPYRVSIFTSPTPVQVGIADVSVSVTLSKLDRSGSYPQVTDAQVVIAWSPMGHDGVAGSDEATHAKATVKSLYADNVTFDTAGDWLLNVTLDGRAGIGTTTFVLTVVKTSLPSWVLETIVAVAIIVVPWGVFRLVSLLRKRRIAKEEDGHDVVETDESDILDDAME